MEDATAVLHYSRFPKFELLTPDNKKIKATGQFADKIFSYRFFMGDKSKLLADKKSIVLSVGLAEKIFTTTQNIVGEMLQ